AGTGDEIQGMKRGLLEVADAVLVSKTDGAAEVEARAFAGELTAALALLRPQAVPHVAPVSAKTGLGVAELLEWLAERARQLEASGQLAARRELQLRRAFTSAVTRELEQLAR